MDKDQKRHLKSGFVRGWELVANTARLCVMNLFLHGVDAASRRVSDGKRRDASSTLTEDCPIEVSDSLAGDPSERFSLILANPPFGKKSSIAIVTEDGDLEKESTGYEWQDFWTSSAGDDSRLAVQTA